ncbi:hypothetical protein [Natrialba aegyptia]|uniref:hypothetical protein n=1 Tax=Natrialba aegyptia TaxID=129789 RepID=UPI00403AE69B
MKLVRYRCDRRCGELGGRSLRDRRPRGIGIDLERPPREPATVTFLAANLTEQGPAWEATLAYEPDAVLHFAGVPRMAETQCRACGRYRRPRSVPRDGRR